MAEPGVGSRLAVFLLPGAASALQAGKRRGRWPRSLSYLLSQAPLPRLCPWAPASALEPNLTPPSAFLLLRTLPEGSSASFSGWRWGGPVGTSGGARGGSKVDQNPSRALTCSWEASPPGGRLALHRCLGPSICLAMAGGVRGCQISPRPGGGGVEASVGSFRSRAEASQLGTGLPLRAWLQGHLGLLERASRLMSGI